MNDKCIRFKEIFSIKARLLVLIWIMVGSMVTAPATGQTATSEDKGFDNYVESIRVLALLRGRQVYEGACAACHGTAGDGNGPAAGPLSPPPRDFTAGIYKYRSSSSGDLPTDDDIYRTITNGVPRTTMPGWADLLTEQERRDVTSYIKTFTADFEDYGASTPIVIPEETEVTAASVSEGMHLYMIMDCWSCHGARGRGDGTSAASLTDYRGRKIVAFDFTTGQYKAGSKNRDVFKTFNTGLDGTPMPSYADVFLFAGDSISDTETYRKTYTEEEIQKLLDYLNSQPTKQQLGSLSESELERLSIRRKWSLVHFVKSLAREPGLFYRLFVHNYDVTQ